MKFVNRLICLFKADVHGWLDRVQDPELILRQALRDMTEELAKKEGCLRRLLHDRDQILKDLAALERQAAKIEADIDQALSRTQDDLARPLIARRLSLSTDQTRRQQHLVALEQEITSFGELVTRQRQVSEDVRLRAAAWVRERDLRRQAGDLVGGGPECSDTRRAPEIELELLRRKSNIIQEDRL